MPRRASAGTSHSGSSSLVNFGRSSESQAGSSIRPTPCTPDSVAHVTSVSSARIARTS